MTFADIPEVVVDYVRSVFAIANDKVSRTLSDHPSMHEEMLDQTLLTELVAAPPAFFAKERAAVDIQTHWLGGRHMWGRWEIADIALIVLLRRAGHLEQRKVALLQTKRLYSKELPVEPLTLDDYVIGIGRLGDRTDPTVPLTRQRAFSFGDDCVYAAMTAGSDQAKHINAYERDRGIPVFYGFYNPLTLPSRALYPALNGEPSKSANRLGCRVQTSTHVHGHLGSLTDGISPTFAGLRDLAIPTTTDPFGASGWRLETFVADEVLRCRQGALFDSRTDPKLDALFYGRGAPISAAIAITIDIGGVD